MNPKRKKILFLIGGVGALITSFFLYQHFMYMETDNAQIEAHVVMLAAKVPGYVTLVKVDEGQKVKKDDVLAEIDSRDYNNTLAQVKGEMASMQARMGDAKKNFDRLQELYHKSAVSQAQYETASSSFSELKAKFEAVSAQFAQAELNLENTKIKAPSDGYIAKRGVEQGQLAASGVPLFGFVSSEARWVVANYKETQIEDIKIGAKADISVDAISKKNFEGHVESISSATGAAFTLLPPDNATGNFTKVVQRIPVKIVIDHLSEEDVMSLRAGLSVMVKVHKH